MQKAGLSPCRPGILVLLPSFFFALYFPQEYDITELLADGFLSVHVQVVIMLVIDRENDRALLSRQSRYVPRMWSCLAGFIEV